MTLIVDAPARADDLQLLGEMVGSGFRTPPAIVRRSDGIFINDSRQSSNGFSQMGLVNLRVDLSRGQVFVT